MHQVRERELGMSKMSGTQENWWRKEKGEKLKSRQNMKIFEDPLNLISALFYFRNTSLDIVFFMVVLILLFRSFP